MYFHARDAGTAASGRVANFPHNFSFSLFRRRPFYLLSTTGTTAVGAGSVLLFTSRPRLYAGFSRARKLSTTYLPRIDTLIIPIGVRDNARRDVAFTLPGVGRVIGSFLPRAIQPHPPPAAIALEFLKMRLYNSVHEFVISRVRGEMNVVYFCSLARRRLRRSCR